MWYIHHVIVQQCKTSHTNNLNHSIITMKPASAAQSNDIISLLDFGHSEYEISQTGFSVASISKLCFRHCPYIKKASGSCPFRLYEQDMLCYLTH